MAAELRPEATRGSTAAPFQAPLFDAPHGLADGHPPLAYRPHSTAPRACRLWLRLTASELAAIAAAAGRAGLTPSGYAAEAAVAASTGMRAPSLMPWREALSELILARAQLRRASSDALQGDELEYDAGRAGDKKRTWSLIEHATIRLDEAAERVQSLATRRNTGGTSSPAQGGTR